MHFFFYGTLMAGSGNTVADAVHRKLVCVGRATARGRLFGVADRRGWYPAVLPGAGVVQGVVYRALPGFSRADLQRMDAYEDYDPANVRGSLYRRTAIPVRLGDGTSVGAMAYVFNGPLPASSPRLPGGDFSAWLAAGSRKAFGD